MINHFGKYHLKIFRWMIKKYFVIFWKISTLLFSCGGAAGYNGPGEGSERRRRGFLLFSFNLHFRQQWQQQQQQQQQQQRQQQQQYYNFFW